MDRSVGGWKNGWIFGGKDRSIGGWMIECLDGWMDGRMV
jgi:hypothetical protein